MEIRNTAKLKVERTHDEFYAKESYKGNTKESFKYVVDLVLKSLAGGGQY